jgi:hypothetical protein
MAEWSNILVERLDAVAPGFSWAVGLQPGLDGEKFERALGDFLQWARHFPLVNQFEALGRHDMAGGTDSSVRAWIDQAKLRADRALEVINSSLWDEFGLSRVDVDEATKAYERLMQVFGCGPGLGTTTRVFFATTNYDRSGEAALASLNFIVNDASVSSTWGGSRRISPESIRLWEDSALEIAPYLHLHGAVGWYREAGGIRVDPADLRFDERQTPAVLYPDPKKDPYDEVGWEAHGLWEKLEEAISQATHVLVLGHSLHDEPLIAAISRSLPPPMNATLAVTYYSADELDRITDIVANRFPSRATIIRCDFHSSGDFNEMAAWFQRQ